MARKPKKMYQHKLVVHVYCNWENDRYLTAAIEEAIKDRLQNGDHTNVVSYVNSDVIESKLIKG